jgi:hypothetical protein
MNNAFGDTFYFLGTADLEQGGVIRIFVSNETGGVLLTELPVDKRLISALTRETRRRRVLLLGNEGNYLRARYKRWRKKNAKSLNAKNRKWRALNTEKSRRSCRQWHARRQRELTDIGIYGIKINQNSNGR